MATLTHTTHNTLTIYTYYIQVTLSLTHYILTYYYYLHVLTLMATCSHSHGYVFSGYTFTHSYFLVAKKKKQQAVTLTVF